MSKRIDTKYYRTKSLDIALNHQLSDGRDLRVADGISARAIMEEVKPGIFDVPKEIMNDPRTKLGFLANKGAGTRSALRPYISPPNQVYPGILSVDPRYDAFKHELAVEASKAFPAAIDEDGFASENCVTRDFSGLLSASGVKMSAANAPPTNREKMLSTAGIASRFVNHRHERIFRALHKFIFGKRVTDTPAQYQVLSSLTMPDHDSGHKSQIIKQTMFRNIALNVNQILNYIKGNDPQSLYNEFGMYFAMRLVERLQSEGVKDLLNGDYEPKARWVADPEYALTHERSGRRYIADKRDVTHDIFGLKYGVAQRVRTAYAVCGQINALMTMVLAGSREWYFNECAYTWHHSTPQSIYDGMKGFVTIRGMDAVTMDQYMPTFLLDKHAEWLSDYFDDRYSTMIKWVNKMAYYAPQLTVGASPFWAGDPRDPASSDIDVGLSSGRADNPDLGKWYMTGVYLCIMDDRFNDLLEYGHDDASSILHILKGGHPGFGLKDMGDDAFYGFKKGYEEFDRQFAIDLKEEGETDKVVLSPYSKLGPEIGIAFLGNVMWRNQLKEIQKPKPNPVTFLVNRHCPERGINTPMRRFWAHGMYAAIEHYSRAGSIIADLVRLETELWRHHLPEYPNPVQFAHEVIGKQPLPTTAALTMADIEVLIDPSKLHYKFRPDDISPEVRSMFTATIPGEFIEKHVGIIWR